MQTEKPVRITVPLPAAAAVALCAAPLPIAPESSGTAVIPSMTMVFFALLSLWKKPEKKPKNKKNQ